MAQKNPQAVAKQWADRLAGSTQKIKDGVNAVTMNPAESALRRQDAYVSGVQRAVAEGKWQRGLQRITLGDWQRAMNEKGSARIASGATAARGKMEQFYSEFLPFVDGVVAKIDASMPRGSLEQNIQRAVAVMQGMSAFRRRT